MGLWEGFIVGYPCILHVQTPPNSTMILLYTSEFQEIINKEFMKSRYIGLFPIANILDLLGLNTCVAFGASPSCGTYGCIADMGAEILRAHGIGPFDKWVDDHIFF